MAAYYTPQGEFEAFDIKVQDADIPENLSVEIHTNHTNATIYDVFELYTEHTAEYIFEIVDKGKLFGIYFHNNGVLSIIPPDDFRFTSQVHIETD